MKRQEKINKKAKDYRLTVTASDKTYGFIIDGSLETNKNNPEVKWYVSNLKWALKKYILTEDVIDAVNDAKEYVNKKFKNYFNDGIPYVGMGIYKIKNDKVQILTINTVKIYYKTDKVEVLEDSKVLKEKNNILKEIKKQSKNQNFDLAKDQILNTIDLKQLYHELNSDNYVYKEISYDHIYTILIANEGLSNYQKYLEFDNTNFYTLVSEQGLNYCYSHLKRIEKREISILPRFKTIDDVTAIYTRFS